MSVSGTDSVNGEVPGTPVKRQQSETEQQVSWSCGGLGVGWSRAERRCESIPRTQGWGWQGSGGQNTISPLPRAFCEEPINTGASRGLTYVAMRREGLRRQCGAVEIVANERSRAPSIGLPCSREALSVAISLPKTSGGRNLGVFICEITTDFYMLAAW